MDRQILEGIAAVVLLVLGGLGFHHRKNGKASRPTAGALPPEYWQMEQQRNAREGTRDALAPALALLEEVLREQEAIRRHIHELQGELTLMRIQVDAMFKRRGGGS